MIFGYLTLFVALLIEVVAAYYSIVGLTAIFSGAVIPIIIMGASLELGKVVAAVWLKSNWDRASITYKMYLLPAVTVLMLITSMGIFGFLSKAHNDQNLVSGDVLSRISVYDEKIKTARENIEANRKALKQMDESVDQSMARSADERGADKAVALRRSQAKERARLQEEIQNEQKTISKISDERAPIAAEVRKVEAEVGPIKYIAKLIYEDSPDTNILEKAVTWVIVIIVAVFDPLALVLILAAQQSIRWAQGQETPKPKKESVTEWFARAKKRARFWDKQHKPTDDKEIDKGQFYVSTLPNVEPVVDQHTHISPEEYHRAMSLFDTEQATPDPYKNASDLKTNIVKDPHTPGWMFTDTPEPADPLARIDVPAIDPEDQLHLLAKQSFMAQHPDIDERVFHAQHQDGEIDRLPWHDIDHINTLPISDGERKKLVDRFVETTSNQFGLEADNVENKVAGELRGFGIKFPTNPNKSDMFLRVDQLPSVLYKFNGLSWIEIDKALSDQHAYDDAYIDHLIEKIDTGEYDPELLSNAERDSIENRLNNKPTQV